MAAGAITFPGRFGTLPGSLHRKVRYHATWYCTRYPGTGSQVPVGARVFVAPCGCTPT